MLRLVLVLVFAAALLGCQTSPDGQESGTKRSASDAHLWDLLHSGGQVVFMRHAKKASDADDPPDFRIGDCSTQVNLSDAGRAQADAVREALKQRGVEFGDVRSSQWCRCLETAKRVAGRVAEDAALNMLEDDAPDRMVRVEALRKRAAVPPTRGNTLLVTHQPNITAVTNLKPRMGDFVVRDSRRPRRF